MILKLRRPITLFSQHFSATVALLRHENHGIQPSLRHTRPSAYFYSPPPAMGGMFSSSSSASNDGTQNTTKSLKQSSSVKPNTIHRTELLSRPVARLTEDINLLIHLDKPIFDEWAEQSLTQDAQWYIEYEVDIAYLQERHLLHMQSLNAEVDNEYPNEMLQRLSITPKALENVIQNKAIVQLCNVSVIRIWLQSEVDGRRLTNEICVVIDVSQRNPHDNEKRKEHFKDVSHPRQLYRSIYGIESNDAPPRLSSGYQ